MQQQEGRRAEGPTQALVAEWQELLLRRNQILAILETLRTRKIIGKSLEATVTLQIKNEDANSVFIACEQSLPELFNVSQVKLQRVESFDPDAFMHTTRSTDGVDIEYLMEDRWRTGIIVARAIDPKCDRCWRHVPDVGDDTRYPTVCLRCAEALDAIDFPPYPAAAS